MTMPVFLYGFARSGTTLLTMMLDSHPQLSVPLSVTGLWYRTIAAGSVDVEALLGHERLQMWNTPLDRAAIKAAIRPEHPQDVIAAFHAAKAASDGKSRWANMDIATIDHVECVAAWYPEAHFVHIVRDGRDVALSHQDYAFSEGNYLEIGTAWNDLTRAADRIGALLGSRHLTIRYEDLVRDPDDTLKQVCAHIDLPYDAAMLDYSARSESKIPKKRRGLWPDINKPPQTDKIARYTTQMTRAQRLVVEAQAREALEHFGYDVAPPQFSLSADVYGCWQYLTRGHRLQRLRAKLGLPAKKVRGSEGG